MIFIIRIYFIVFLFLFNAIIDIWEYLFDKNNIRIEMLLIDLKRLLRLYLLLTLE